MATSERMSKLQQMLERQPGDVFLLYAIALEHRKLGNFAAAIEFLNRVIQEDSGYRASDHQAAQVHESTGDLEAARGAYREGIIAAQRKGDLHAKEEMEGALSQIE